MQKIRYLKIQFENALFPYEVQYFRAAVIEHSKRKSILFHNHSSDGGFRYKYPLIQYKVTGRKATIICLNEGTDDIHYFLQNRNMKLQIGNRSADFEISDVHLQYVVMQTWDATFHYSLKHWMALNQDNYKHYQQLEREVDRIQFLEKLLTGHLLGFAEGVGWHVDNPIKIAITKMKGEKFLEYKQVKQLCFSLNFKTNVRLPDYIGLGKGAAQGFGIVMGFGDGSPSSHQSKNKRIGTGRTYTSENTQN